LIHDAAPPFEPHPWLRGGDLQTIAGRYLPGRRVRLASRYHEVALSDNDRLALLDSRPARWSAGDPAALLVHGLGGCARAPYVTRIAARLAAAGARVVRMNLRGAGAGHGLARGIYHSGRTEDLRAAAGWLAARAVGSPLALVGFSLGANLVLKLAAEHADEPVDGLDCVVAANPPLDLAACCRHIRSPRNRPYDRNFVRGLRREIERHHARFPELGAPGLDDVDSLFAFDDAYTAPRHGFADADDYYRRSSAGPLLTRIRIPGLVVHSIDDPFIPADSVARVAFPCQLRLELVSSGGHLGYLSRRPWGGSRRWLDARICSWLLARWQEAAPNASSPAGRDAPAPARHP
jgi:predicted alpha/beta-fold hydrolase